MADPDFPEVGAPTLQGGAATYNFAKFPPKLHGIEKTGPREGTGPKLYYVDPPLQLPKYWYSELNWYKLILKLWYQFGLSNFVSNIQDYGQLNSPHHEIHNCNLSNYK